MPFIVKPIVDFFEAVVLNTTDGIIFIPINVLSKNEVGFYKKGNYLKAFKNHTKTSDKTSLSEYKIFGAREVKGWFICLSLNGEIFCTDWQGAFNTKEEALSFVKKQYDLDEKGKVLLEEEKDRK